MEVSQYDHRSQQLGPSIKMEIEDLLKRKTSKVLCRQDILVNANILVGRFVLAVKDEGTHRKISKAGYIVQGHKCFVKLSIVHSMSGARQYFAKILLVLAGTFGFQICSTEVVQANLQSAERLDLNIFVKRCREF